MNCYWCTLVPYFGIFGWRKEGTMEQALLCEKVTLNLKVEQEEIQ